MSNRCVDCKFYDSDWEWDGEDECRIDICLERHNEYLESSEDCPFFQPDSEENHTLRKTRSVMNANYCRNVFPLETWLKQRWTLTREDISSLG